MEDSQIIGWPEPTTQLFDNGATVDKWSKQMKPRFCGERLPRVEESRYTERAANLSYISLQNVATRLHEKQKTDSDSYLKSARA